MVDVYDKNNNTLYGIGTITVYDELHDSLNYVGIFKYHPNMTLAWYKRYSPYELDLSEFF